MHLFQPDKNNDKWSIFSQLSKLFSKVFNAGGQKVPLVLLRSGVRRGNLIWYKTLHKVSIIIFMYM